MGNLLAMKKILLVLFIFHFSLFTVKAQYSILLTFTGTSGSFIGALPYGSFTLSGDTLYGMTKQGGIYGNDGYGVIFSVQINGTDFRNLVDFNGANGEYPGGSLILSGDTLYGMTTIGGMYGFGDIFSVQTNGINFKDLVDFTGDTGSNIGGYPQYGSLILAGDTLYGMTTEAYNGLDNISNGIVIGNGNVFSVQTNGTNYKNLIDFSGDTGSYIGKWPFGSLTLSGDTLYGMTSVGGTSGNGNIFSVQTNGTNYRDLVNFTGSSGSYVGSEPSGSLILSGNTFYGMTSVGGISGDGNIFSVQTNGTNFNDLLDFTDYTLPNIGEYPSGSLILSGNILYGMTSGGLDIYGNIFSIQTNGMNYRDLVEFTGLSGSYIGVIPFGSLTLLDNVLYGMTSEQAYSYLGNIFNYRDTSITTSINSSSACNGQLKLYPNPNNGMFTISLGHPELVSGTQTIEIQNVLGEKVFTSTLPPPNGRGVSSACEINISSQPNGVYFYRAVGENGELIGEGKVVVDR